MNSIILNSETDVYLKKGKKNVCLNSRLINSAVLTGMIIYAV
jgi:hypothetical protein